MADSVVEFIKHDQTVVSIRAVDNGDGTYSLAVGGSPSSGAVTQGAITNRSGTITLGGTAQQLAAAKASRRYLLIQNPSTATGQGLAVAESLWIDFTAAAVQLSPSIELLPGAGLVLDAMAVPTDAISVIAATTGHKWTAKEL